MAPQSEFDELERLANAAGLRSLSSRHLTLITDLPPEEAVDQLPEMFDLAYPQWRQYFGVAGEREAEWRMIGFLMVDRQRFATAGLIPEDLPDFLHGYTLGDRFWMNEQPTDYYRRHLMLHEGTHGFMYMRLGGCGPPWYMEGIAELLATHRLEALDEGLKLTLNYFPADRSDMPYWGRIKIVKDGFASGAGHTLADIFRADHRSFLRNDPYGWCWAAAAFLDGHPRYSDRFRRLPRHVAGAEFNRELIHEFDDELPEIFEEWHVFVANLEYGYDLKRMAIDFSPGKPLAEGERATVTVQSNRGWQSTGVQVSPGDAYQLTASGRYQIARLEKTWWCEPGGVTIRYYQGLPLGVLLAAVRPNDTDGTAPSALLSPTPVGLEAALHPERAGTLYLRINDSAAELDDNEGAAEVVIRRRQLAAGSDGDKRDMP